MTRETDNGWRGDRGAQDSRGPNSFPYTRWSMVAQAARPDESDSAFRALSEICERYRPPIYEFVRRLGFSADDADDVTQGFFSEVISKEVLARADPRRGKLRSFLLVCLKRFLSNHRDRTRAQKRGGGFAHVSLEEEELAGREPVDETTPEIEYERKWALTLLESVMKRLQRDYGERGKEWQYERLRSLVLQSADHVRYPELAGKLSMTVGALKVAVYRLRKRFRQFLREQVAETVDNPGEVDEELRYLAEVLAGISSWVGSFRP